MKKKEIIILLFLVCVWVPFPVSALTLPDTGQTTSYTGVVGEDHDYLINPMTYAKMGTVDGQLTELADTAPAWIVVQDKVTGLMWEVKTTDGSSRDMDTKYSYNESAGYMSGLNTALFGGYADWRVPTLLELMSLADFSMTAPAINSDFFPNCISSIYISSTENKLNTDNAFMINFNQGNMTNSGKNSSYYIRAVRGGADVGGAMVDNGDTVTDTNTGLMWHKAGSGGTQMKWEAALSWCETLDDYGYDDWRLPSIRELVTIADFSQYNPAIDDTLFTVPTTTGRYYYTSTTSASDPLNVWNVNFYLGFTGNESTKVVNYRARPVRGGQQKVTGNLYITAPGQGSTQYVGNIMAVEWETAGISENVGIWIIRNGIETKITETANTGAFTWVVEGTTSPNCELKIEPVTQTGKGTTQGYFTIAPDTPPSIVDISPTADATDISRSTDISLAFSEPMDETTLTGGMFTVTGNVHGAYAGNLSFDATTATWTFSLSGGEKFEFGEILTAAVSGNVKDLNGSALDGGAYAWSFAIVQMPMGNITGRLLTDVAGYVTGIQGATVSYAGTFDGKSYSGDISTDANGNYSILDIPDNTEYQISIVADHFVDESATRILSGSDIVIDDMTMELRVLSSYLDGDHLTLKDIVGGLQVLAGTRP